MDDQELDLYFKQRLELELKDPSFLINQLLVSQKTVLELRKQNAILEPKAELHDKIVRVEDNLSMTEVARLFKVKPQVELIPYLSAQDYIFKYRGNWKASSKAIAQGILANKVLDNIERYGFIATQAIIEPSMLPKWESNVIPNLKRWLEK